MLTLLLLPLLTLPADVITDYQKWLNEDVKYIISSREKKEFRSLDTDQERAQFIQEFWRRRDPDPSTALNEYKEEHYARIEYANQHFDTEGRPGWMTERGRVYIINGPPDHVSHYYGQHQKVSVANPTTILNPAGEALPFVFVEVPTPESETWVYRYLPGSVIRPSRFTVIFAKMDTSDLFTLKRFIARAAINDIGAASGGSSSSLQRRFQRDQMIKAFITKQQYMRNDMRVVYAGGPELFDLAELIQVVFNPSQLRELDLFSIGEAKADLMRSPGERLEERWQRRRKMQEMVESRLFFDTLPLEVGFGFLRHFKHYVQIPLQMVIDLPEEPKRKRLDLEVYAELVDSDDQVAAQFQENVQASRKELGERINYQSRMAVAPGDYRMRVMVSDLEGERLGLWEKDVRVPDLRTDQFESSELMIIDKVFPVDQYRQLAKDRGAHADSWLTFNEQMPLLLDDNVFIPSTGQAFRRGETLTALLEVYNPTLEGHEPQVEIQAICQKKGQPIASTRPALLDYTTGEDDSHIIYAFSIPLQSFDFGDYNIVVRITDRPTGEIIEKRAAFKIF